MHAVCRLAAPPTAALVNVGIKLARPAFSTSTRASPRTAPLITRQQRHASTSAMASTDATLRAFFQSPKYAVVGASTNTAKYGYKVFRWYVLHGLPVTPINPGSQAIEVDGTPHPTVASLSELQGPAETGVSIITPPHVTLKVLQEAKELGVQAVFLQPGTFDDDVLAYGRANFKTFVGGEGGAGSEGWCVLVDGERGLNAAGKL